MRADLASLKKRLNVKSADADELLQHDLDVATAWVDDRVYPSDQDPATRHIDVTEAILLLASRLYARRNSPEGVSGWGDLGVIQIIARDPDVSVLLERHIDYSSAGLA